MTVLALALARSPSPPSWFCTCCRLRWRALHLLVGTLVWVGLVVLVYRTGSRPQAGRRAGRTTARPARPPDRAPTLIADLITLTKPRIISLLLVTTIAPMFITGHGLPRASSCSGSASVGT